MFHNINYAWQNHKNRVRLLTEIPVLTTLYNSVKGLFVVIVILDILYSLSLFKSSTLIGTISIFTLTLIIPMYYIFIKILAYCIIWASKNLQVNIHTSSDFDA